MPTSQNVLFKGAPPADEEFDHPPGCYIARVLHRALADTDWAPADFDNWRDVGWSIECAQGNSTLQITVAQVEDGTWMLQVAPAVVPGVLGRLFKRQPSGGPAHCLPLAKAVHSILTADTLFSGFRWCWDGYPDEETATSEPVAHNESG